MLIIDAEADGLKPTKIHCLSWADADTDDEPSITFDYQKMREVLTSGEHLVCHNGIRYDAVVFRNLLGVDIQSLVVDTLPLSWYLFHDRQKHGLGEWGVDLGVPKPPVDDWENLSPEEYAYRCSEDVKINRLLWRKLKKKLQSIYRDSKEEWRLTQYLMHKMRHAAIAEEHGWRIDRKAIEGHIETLSAMQEDTKEKLEAVMPLVPRYKRRKRPKILRKKDGSLSSHALKWIDLLKSEGLPLTTEEFQQLDIMEPPNAASHDQLKDWLTTLGWTPCTFKFVRDQATGNERQIPQVRKGKELTPSVLRLIQDNPEVKLLEDFSVVNHRLSFFEGFIEGDRGGSRVSARIAGFTNTLRFKHAAPLCNIPGVLMPWGKEIRSCLLPDDGQILCGTDMSSLEDATKRHYIKPIDSEYVEEISKPGYDSHLALAVVSGMLTQEQADNHKFGEEDHGDIRYKAKQVNYMSVYGVGVAKLARYLGIPEGEAKRLLDAYWKINWSVKEVSKTFKKRKVNGELWVQNPVSGFWYSLRYEKDAFSTVNQSTGAYCFDLWLTYVLQRWPLVHGQFHDEFTTSVPPEQREELREIIQWAIGKVNQKLKLNVTLEVDVKTGQSYSEVH